MSSDLAMCHHARKFCVTRLFVAKQQEKVIRERVALEGVMPETVSHEGVILERMILVERVILVITYAVLVRATIFASLPLVYRPMFCCARRSWT
jgi:hypothetical protein